MRTCSQSVFLSLSAGVSFWAVMLFVDCKMVDFLRGRRRMRVSICKPPCSFWFLLLFGVGGLVLFIHLQDLSDMVLQQAPGRKKRSIMVNRQHVEWIQTVIYHVEPFVPKLSLCFGEDCGFGLQDKMNVVWGFYVWGCTQGLKLTFCKTCELRK